MRPVVADPSITFVQLVNELETVTDADLTSEILTQLAAKIQRWRTRLEGAAAEEVFAVIGQTYEDFCVAVRQPPQAAKDVFAMFPQLASWLDTVPAAGDGS